MAQRRTRKTKSIPLKIGNDPALWRYASVQEALAANTDLIARLIRAGREQSARKQPAAAVQSQSVPLPESA